MCCKNNELWVAVEPEDSNDSDKGNNGNNINNSQKETYKFECNLLWFIGLAQ